MRILALAIVLPFIGFLILLVLISGALLISKVKDWEVQYGPYKFNYIDLSIATKGFKDTEILGKEVFGRVYRDVLPASNIQVTVKRVDHDLRQRMREFVVEIATIGCLRNPNLVRLLVYSRLTSTQDYEILGLPNYATREPILKPLTWQIFLAILHLSWPVPEKQIQALNLENI
ncbi:hypothetical protein CsSME_00039256 [Camellia sinensis var. sinensis]